MLLFGLHSSQINLCPLSVSGQVSLTKKYIIFQGLQAIFLSLILAMTSFANKEAWNYELKSETVSETC